MVQTVCEELAEYKTESLFVLVGRNPLPNYVAARLLLKPGGALYLIHSDGEGGTAEIARNLAAQLGQFTVHRIAVDPLETKALRARVQEYLKRPTDGGIGLNYTGGTKVMAVQAYEAVQEHCKNSGCQPIVSYLDADTLDLCIEPVGGRPAWRRKVALLVKPSLETLFGLHGITPRSAFLAEPTLVDLAGALARLHGTAGGVEAWKKARKTLGTFDGRRWSDVKAEWLGFGVAPDVLTHLQQALGLIDPETINLSAAARRAGFSSYGKLKTWLVGGWLESWTLFCVKNLDVEHCARNLEQQAGPWFEIDVALMQGYQLFAFSCTVSTRAKPAKLKLLEVYARARQLGGDEACVGIVCPVDDPQHLQDQIVREWDAPLNRVKVFGREKIPNLKDAIDNWLKSVKAGPSAGKES